MKRIFSILLVVGAVLMVGAGTADALCGDGVFDPGESCDDHNTRDDDCCSSTCELIECNIEPVSLVRWQEMGPSSVGGRVTALAVDPEDSSRVVLGSPAGGIWETTDGADSWQSLTPWLAITSISAVAIHPTDPQIIVAGTGSITDGGSVSSGIGIIRSDDGGSRWWQVTNRQIVPYIASILFWEEEPQRVLAATDLGVLLSLDGGQNFEYALQGQAISAFVRDPNDADALFATSRSGLFLSRNRGDSWSRVSSWPLLETDLHGAGTTALAVSQQTPGLLFAVVQVFSSFGETDRALVLRSTDGGLTFTEIGAPDGLCESVDSCGYGLAMAVHPDDDDRLLIGGDALFASTDGGDTWSEFGIDVGEVHEISPHSDGAYLATATGVGVVNGAWDSAEMRNAGLAITSVVSLDASDQTQPRLLAGTADTGTILGIGEDPSWSVIFGKRKPAGTTRFDPFDDDRLYVSRPHARFFRSDDGGQSFSPIMDGLQLSQRSAGVTPFEPSTLIPDTLFTALLQPFQSTDAGESWQVFRPEGFPEVTVMATSPVDSDRLYFALADGATLFKADDIHTESVSITTEPNHRITSVYLDPAAENIIYASLTNTSSQTGRVFKSWNFGADWQDISPAGLPATTSIVKDVFGALYVGSADGVWRSANDGFSWARFQSGLLGSGVTTLSRGPDRIYAGTTGRGVYSMPVIGLTSIESIPDGQLFWVDNELVRTPHFVLWDPGSVHTVEPYLLQTADSRQYFQSWSDGGGLSHDVVVGEGTSAIAGAVGNLFMLDLSASPETGGSVDIQPLTADHFFPENSVVSWVAVPAPDHRFVGFSGDLSGGQDNYGFAVMDRPRSIVAEFEPLSMTIETDPPGLGMTIDGKRTPTPRSFDWSVGTVHDLAADAVVDLDPSDPEVLAFEKWSDLFAREHSITVRRDTFITNLTAKYITIIPELDVPGRSARVFRTVGTRAWAKIAALTMETDDGGIPPNLRIASSRIGGELVSELALGPSEPVLEAHCHVDGGTDMGKTRIVLHNPGADEAVVDLLLRDEMGNGLVARVDALRVAPGGRNVGYLEELISLGDPYEGLLSVFSDQPVVVSLQGIRSNLRPTTLLEPILVVRPMQADRGVPENPSTQTLILTPDTEHELVLANPGNTALTGTLAFLDEAAEPLALADQMPSNQNYNIPPGGYRVIRFAVQGAGGAGVPATGRVGLNPTLGQNAPLVQLVEEQTVGVSVTGPIVLTRSIPASERRTSFAVPVDWTRRDSGVIVNNPSGFNAVNLEVRLLDLDGAEIGTTAVSVGASRQMLILGREFFPSVGESFRGVLLFTSPSELETVGVIRQLNGRGEEILAGFPVLGEATAGDSKIFGFAIDGDSWSSELWQVNSWSANPVTIDFSFTGQTGETMNLPMEW